MLATDQITTYSPDLAAVVGGVTSAIFLTQLLSLLESDPLGMLCVSEAEIREETGLNRREQQAARRKLSRCGVITIQPGCVQTTHHFRIVWDRLFGLITDYLSV